MYYCHIYNPSKYIQALHASRFSDELNGTIVISQSPEGGTRVLWGSPVRIEMGTLVTVPRVISMGASGARRKIERAGLRVHQDGPSTNSIVSMQSPEGGDFGPKGSTVTIHTENPNL